MGADSRAVFCSPPYSYPKAWAHPRHWAETLFLWGKLGGAEVVNHPHVRQGEQLGFEVLSHTHWVPLRRKGVQDFGSCTPHLPHRCRLALRYDSTGVWWAIFNQLTSSSDVTLGTWVEYVILEVCHYSGSWEIFLGATSRACNKFFWVYCVGNFLWRIGYFLEITKIQLENIDRYNLG